MIDVREVQRELTSLSRDLLHERVVKRSVDVHALGGEAQLAGVLDASLEHRGRGGRHIGRRRHDDRVVAAELEECRNESLRAADCDLPARGSAAGEAEDVDLVDDRLSDVGRARPRTAARTAAPESARTMALAGSTNRGVTSLGLTITAQPASNAGMASSVASRKGWFQGLMTPSSE